MVCVDVVTPTVWLPLTLVELLVVSVWVMFTVSVLNVYVSVCVLVPSVVPRVVKSPVT